MLVVLDTTVIYQSLYSNAGASFFIMGLVRDQKIKMALSLKVFAEYEAVLKRRKSLKDFELKIDDIEKILIYLAYIGRPFDTHYLFRPNLLDENDNIFIELAVASNSKYLITSNIKDFKNNAQLKFADFDIVTPADFLKRWRR